MQTDFLFERKTQTKKHKNADLEILQDQKQLLLLDMRESEEDEKKM